VTIANYERQEKVCPACRDKRLVFITYAPKKRATGKSVQHRCKSCTLAEATESGEEVYVIHHLERRGLPKVWERNRLIEQPKGLRNVNEARVGGATAHADDF
jgi:hypothetical protein